MLLNTYYHITQCFHCQYVQGVIHNTTG